jgi:hypothetical protein
MACSHGRTYEKELFGRYTNATSSLSWIAFGEGYVNQSAIAPVLFALSSYEPAVAAGLGSVVSGAAAGVAGKEANDAEPAAAAGFGGFVSEAAAAAGTRGSQELEDLREPEDPRELHLSQGKRGFVNVTTYRSKHYLLSTAEDFKPGRPGYQEHILQATLGPEALIWVNHPGERSTAGLGRPSYWAGNGTLPRVRQYRNTALAIFHVDAGHPVDFTHAYFPAHLFEQSCSFGGANAAAATTAPPDPNAAAATTAPPDADTASGNPAKGTWHAGAHGSSYVAVWHADGGASDGMSAAGPYAGRELVEPGRHAAWIVKLGSQEEFGSFEAFCTSLQEAEADWSSEHNAEQPGPVPKRIRFADPQHGLLELPWSGPFTVDGREVEIVRTDSGGERATMEVPLGGGAQS